MAIGAITGTSIYIVWCKHKEKLIDWKWILISAVIGAITGILADIIERPTSSFHRQFFHSFVFLLLLIFLLWKVYKSKINQDSKIAFFVSVIG